MKILEQIDSALLRKGLSPAAASRAAVKNSSLIKNIKAGSSPSVENLGKLAEVLDLELYFGPPRSKEAAAGFSGIQLPIIGWARCGTRGDGPTEEDVERTAPSPVGFDQEAAFYAKAKGHSMRPEGIASGDYALIDPSRTPVIGDRVWVKDIKQLASLKRFTRQTDQSLNFRGWLDPGNGGQQSFDVEMPRAAVAELYSVAAVFDGPPDGTNRPSIRPDPRAMEFGLATPASSQIAAALDLDEGSTEDQIVEKINMLKRTADDMVQARKLIAELMPITNRLKNL